ncbi:MAG TPA: hypothetical protein VFC00_02635 [Micromonosporaceae bacterium]|nr:hypothetical protein [Micromonosporaceae bacterium]
MGFEGWLAVIRSSAEEYEYFKNEERSNPVACPNDGEPLRSGPDGQPYCPFDGWRPNDVR